VDRKKQIQVLFLPRWYPHRDDPQLGVFIRKQAEAIAPHCEVAVIYPQASSSVNKAFEDDFFERQGVQTFLVYYAHRTGGILAHTGNAFRYMRAFFRAWKQYRRSLPFPDLIHVHVLLRPLLMAYFLRLFKKTPIVLSEHWTGYVFGFFAQKSLLTRWLSRRLLASVSTLTVVSPALEKAMKASGLSHPDCRIVPNVVEVGDGMNEKKEHDDTRILTVADLVERNKNVAGVIKAVEQIARDRQDFRYDIIGGGEDETLLKSLAKHTGLLGDRIHFLGRLDNEEVIRHIRQCDFLVVNSNVETFSVITAESLACGKPVIATRSGGPEFFMTEECGILIPPGDQDALKSAICDMLDHHHEYDPAAMRAVVEKQFSAEAVGRQLLSLYQEKLSE
jgi:glycosyltransferase involved in cell wall biosynthesis